MTVLFSAEGNGPSAASSGFVTRVSKSSLGFGMIGTGWICARVLSVAGLLKFNQTETTTQALKRRTQESGLSH